MMTKRPNSHKPGISALILILFAILPLVSLAQHNNLETPLSVNVSGDAPDSSAIVDIQSEDKGMLVPRLSAVQRMNIASPADGLLVYDMDSLAFYYYDGTEWTGIITSPEDADASPMNELQDLSLSLDELSLTGDLSTVDLSSYKDNTDEQTLTFNNPNLSISNGNSVNLSALTSDEYWETSSGTNITNTNIGNVGIGNMAPTLNRWQLTVKDTVNSMLGSDSVDVSELFAVFTRNINENNIGVGIGFQSTSTVTGVGAAIVHERTSSNSRGKLHFATKQSSSAADEDLPIRMTIDETGDVGIGTTSPTEKLHVQDGDVLVQNGDVFVQNGTLDVSNESVIGNIGIGNQSTDQGTSNADGLGFLTTPWLYTNAIEAQGERGSGSTLITLGNDGTYGTGDEIHFVTSGSSQMRVASDGKVGLDVDPNTDLHIRQSQQSITNGNGGIKFEESGNSSDYWRIFHSGIYFSFNLQGSRVSYINTNGAYTVDSDRSLKKGIQPMNNVLDRVAKLQAVSYRYKEQPESAQRSLGFIAQDIRPLFPELVVEGEDGKLGMTYAQTGVIALKAIQEQQEEIEMYKERVRHLEREIEQIKEILEELKN